MAISGDSTGRMTEGVGWRRSTLSSASDSTRRGDGGVDVKKLGLGFELGRSNGVDEVRGSSGIARASVVDNVPDGDGCIY